VLSLTRRALLASALGLPLASRLTAHGQDRDPETEFRTDWTTEVAGPGVAVNSCRLTTGELAVLAGQANERFVVAGFGADGTEQWGWRWPTRNNRVLSSGSAIAAAPDGGFFVLADRPGEDPPTAVAVGPDRSVEWTQPYESDGAYEQIVAVTPDRLITVQMAIKPEAFETHVRGLDASDGTLVWESDEFGRGYGALSATAFGDSCVLCGYRNRIARVTADGSVPFNRRYLLDGNDELDLIEGLQDIAVGPDGRAVAVGSGSNGRGERGIHCLAVDQAGEMQWQQSLSVPHPTDVRLPRITADPDSGFVVAGSYDDAAAIAVARLDPDGSVVTESVVEPFDAETHVEDVQSVDDQFVLFGESYPDGDPYTYPNRPWLAGISRTDDPVTPNTLTPSPTPSPTPTRTPTDTATPTRTATATPTPTATESSEQSSTQTNTRTQTATAPATTDAQTETGENGPGFGVVSAALGGLGFGLLRRARDDGDE